MNRSNRIRALRFSVLMLLASTVGYLASAQEKISSESSVNVTTKSTSTEGWYAAPWVWVVGAAVFILLLVAILNNRGGSRSNG